MYNAVLVIFIVILRSVNCELNSDDALLEDARRVFDKLHRQIPGVASAAPHEHVLPFKIESENENSDETSSRRGNLPKYAFPQKRVARIAEHNWLEGPNNRPNPFVGGGSSGGVEVMIKTYYDDVHYYEEDVLQQAKQTRSMCSSGLELLKMNKALTNNLLTSGFLEETAYPVVANMESIIFEIYYRKKNHKVEIGNTDAHDYSRVVNFLDSLEIGGNNLKIGGNNLKNPMFKLRGVIEKKMKAVLGGMRYWSATLHIHIRKNLSCFYYGHNNSVSPLIIPLAYASVVPLSATTYDVQQKKGVKKVFGTFMPDWKAVGWFAKAQFVKDPKKLDPKKLDPKKLGINAFIEEIRKPTSQNRIRDQQTEKWKNFNGDKGWKDGCEIQKMFFKKQFKVTVNSSYLPPFPEENFAMGCLGIFPKGTIVTNEYPKVCTLEGSGNYEWKTYTAPS